MASIYKNGKKWRADVKIMINYEVFRDSRTFTTKAAATVWAEEREKELRRGNIEKVDLTRTFKEALERYAKEETPKKQSARSEGLRINAILRCEAINVNLRLTNLNANYFNNYVEYRTKSVSNATINKEMSVIRSVIREAKDNWKWIEHDPFQGMKKLPEPPPRNRRISETEIETILSVLNYKEDKKPTEARQRVAIMFLLAIETGMRLGEMTNLTWNNIFIKDSYLKVAKSKNTDARDVPLSERAIILLEKVRFYSKDLIHDVTGEDEFGRKLSYKRIPVFCQDWEKGSKNSSALFKKYVRKTYIEDLTFHDTRHEACTRLARKINVLDLAKMIGHRDINTLMIYYNPTASEIASRLG